MNSRPFKINLLILRVEVQFSLQAFVFSGLDWRY